MANSGAYKVYSELPAWAKGVVVIGGIAIVYFTGRTIYKSIAKKAQSKKDSQTVRDVKDEIRDNQNQGKRQSYPDSQYKAWADSIEKAFDGCDPFETAQNTINRAVRELKNNTDWLKLVDAYGVRTYDQCGLWTGNFTGNLYSAISDELDSAEKSYINKLLSERNISYKVS